MESRRLWRRFHWRILYCGFSVHRLRENLRGRYLFASPSPFSLSPLIALLIYECRWHMRLDRNPISPRKTLAYINERIFRVLLVLICVGFFLCSSSFSSSRTYKSFHVSCFSASGRSVPCKVCMHVLGGELAADLADLASMPWGEWRGIAWYLSIFLSFPHG